MPALARVPGRVGITPGGLGGLPFQLVVAIYGGFRRRGMGILTPAAPGDSGHRRYPGTQRPEKPHIRSDYTVTAATFILAGAISWPHTAVMLITATAGGYGRRRLRPAPARLWLRLRLVVAVGRP